ncbi:MAG: glycosyltransferase family 2 protein [Deltaproteobacteria bacterium]|nr:glycosyltransferase family 2 protein [Deltaproteobacteria bacterium]
MSAKVSVIIPALDEEAAIAGVVSGLRVDSVREVIVVDNGSHDRTAERASAAGARVVHQPERGYGAACLAGIAALPPDTDLVVFADGDGSDDPASLPALLAPLLADTADMVVGSRVLGLAEPGSLAPAQRLGNWIAANWLRRRFGLHATDLGPFRAIRRSALDALEMRDRDYGWTVEMQIKAARHGLRYKEVPVRYRRRLGRSKVSGTLRGTLGAAYKIIGWLARHDSLALRPSRTGS